MCNQFRQNFYTLIGILLGLFFGSILIPILENGCFRVDFSYNSNAFDNQLLSEEYVPKINLAGKPVKAQKNPQKLLRPRYFSTELGIRKKLFVAVLTTQQTINTKGIVVNKTTSHLVDKLTFFIDAPGTQKLNVSYLKLPGIVGFIDTRVILKPFHVLKYIKDNYIENYDFFFIVNDSAYIKARKLNELVQKISISRDVYASTKIPDSLFCSLDAGILFSNSLIQRMVRNIDWCVKNVFSSSDDDNFGRCALHSSNIPCQEMVQGNKFESYHLTNEEKLDSDAISQMLDSVTVYPIKNVKTFYTLHAYFSKIELERTNAEIASIRKSIVSMSEFTPDGSSSVTWPIGNQPGNKPITRFDVLRWDYFNESHIYLSTDFDIIRFLNDAEKKDIQLLIKSCIDMISAKYSGIYQYHSLVNGYRKFDPSRGMDYKLDIAFRDTTNDKIIQKRLEVCKPLGKIEILPVPYVTENRRINILLPVRVNDKSNVNKFLQQYKTVCLEKKEKTFLMLVLIYEYNVPGKGTKDDIFQDFKNQAVSLTKTYQRDDNRVAWVSIKLPSSENRAMEEALLYFAVVDIAMRKFNSDSLILIGSPEMEIRIEYLNRVRMNTIQGWQIFSPIPFSEYNPTITKIPAQQYMDINKRQGRFDIHNTLHISFYVKDYITTRKKIENLIPVIKSDSDIRVLRSNLIDRNNFTGLALHTIYSMFVRFGDVHVIRGVEPALRLKYREIDCHLYEANTDTVVSAVHTNCQTKRNFNLGSRSQLSKLILEYQDNAHPNFTLR